MAFHAAYEFKQSGKHIVLKHKHGAHLRTSPGNVSQVDGHGGQGVNAQWIVHLEGGNHCRLQNAKRYHIACNVRIPLAMTYLVFTFQCDRMSFV